MTKETSHLQNDGSSPSQKSKATETDSGKPISATETSRVVGPVAPRHLSDSELQQEPSDDSSDDDFGPQLPPVATTESSKPTYGANSRSSPSLQDVATEGATAKKRQRDDWMLNPPENTSWAAGMNPAALTNRKFMTGKTARGDQSTEGIGSVWTESPSQKRQRLENEVLGIRAAESIRSAGPKDLSSRKNQAAADKVKSLSVSTYTPSFHRSTDGSVKSKSGRSSLYEKHQTSNHETKEDDPSLRAFDWEKDVAGKTNISGGARKKLLNQASDYSSRFSGGKYI